MTEKSNNLDLLGREVIYTPEIVTITKGKPIKAIVRGVGIDDTFRLLLPDGSECNVESRLCSAEE